MTLSRLLAAALVTLGTGAAAQDCGGADAPCALPDGTYHIALPASPEGAPAMVFLHGYGGSGRGAVANSGLVADVTARGYALISPSGQQDPSGAFRRDWGVADGFTMPRDDIAFIGRVLDDAAARFGLDRDRMLLTGFSRGGSMVWDIACNAPGTAAAYAAASGGFWQPFPDTCTGPVHLHHAHGFTDRTVPLEGRKAVFNGHPFHQGNILAGLDIWRATMGCEGAAEDSSTAPQLWRKRWTGCAGGALTLDLWPGGHGLPPGWRDTVLDWFEETVPPRD